MSPVSFAGLLVALVLLFVALCLLYLRRHKTPTPWDGNGCRAGKWLADKGKPYVALVLIAVAGMHLLGCQTPAADYVAADKANFDDIGADYGRYVNGDPLLTPAERQGKLDSLELWRQRVRAAGDPPGASETLAPSP